MTRTYISFSAYKRFNECPFSYKLKYIDEVSKFKGSIHTCFGTAMHYSIEQKMLNSAIDEVLFFKDKFTSELEAMKLEGVVLTAEEEKEVVNMFKQGEDISPLVIPALEEKFPGFKLLAAEEDIDSLIEEGHGLGYNFKGFIDAVIQTPDNKIHILDWKTCSWGWDSKKKGDPLVTYQLVFYKHYYAVKHNIDLKNIEIHFGLLKRTSKKNRVEIFRVTSGPKKMKNAFNILSNTLYNIGKNRFPKNRTSCKYCEFKESKECP